MTSIPDPSEYRYSPTHGLIRVPPHGCIRFCDSGPLAGWHPRDRLPHDTRQLILDAVCIRCGGDHDWCQEVRDDDPPDRSGRWHGEQFTPFDLDEYQPTNREEPVCGD